MSLPVVGDRVSVAPSDRYPAGREGVVRDVSQGEFGRWFTVESVKDPGVIWTLTELQVSGR